MKQTILFVDADAAALAALEQSLASQAEHWNMAFAEEPRQALAMLDAQPADVVVAAMKLPGMDGMQLLADVARDHPRALRVILSGYAEEGSLLRGSGAAHQYLTKSPDPAEIIALMERTRRLAPVLGNERLQSLAAGLRNLPSPPDLFLRISRAIQDERTSTKALADMIAGDTAMTAELLRLANSSYFAQAGDVTTVLRALLVLGLDSVRLLIFSSGIFRAFRGRSNAADRIRALNEYGLAISALAEHLAGQGGADRTVAAHARCAGTVLVIGTLVLMDAYPREYVKVLSQATAATLADAERARFGASQGEVGAYLLGLWGFPEEVVEAVFYQSHPSLSPNQQRSALTYVHLAQVFGPPFPLFKTHPSPEELIDKAYVARLGLGPELAAAARPPGVRG